MLLFMSMETVFGIPATQIGQYDSVLDSNQYSREKRAEYVITFHDTLSEILSRLSMKIISYLCQYFIYKVRFLIYFPSS